MRDGYHNDSAVFDAINQRVGKAGKEKPPDIGLNLHSRTWVASDEPNDAIQLIEEITTQASLGFASKVGEADE